MKSYFNNLVFISLLMLVNVQARSDISTGENVDLKIELSKDNYNFREPIWLDVTLHNRGDESIEFSGLFPPCQGEFIVELKDSLGNQLNYTGLIYNMKKSKGRKLEPDEIHYDCYDILELFSTFKSLLRQRFGFIPKGKYKVVTKYRGINSNVLNFEVIDTNEMESKAYQLLDSAYTLWPKKEFELANDFFQRIIDNYPNSVYIGKALRELPQRCELFLNIPNSGYVKMFLKEKVNGMSYNEKQDYLRQVVLNYQNTRISKFAEQMLRMMDKEIEKDNKE